MPLQTDNLAMIALAVVGNEPVINPYQAPLASGIHLRWGCPRDLGFPWHGFYLFRRLSRPGRSLCLSSVIGGLKKGDWPDNKHYTAIGLLSSNTNLVLTDVFAPNDRVEFALGGRNYLRFDLPEGELARLVELRIGFALTCLDFEKLIAPAVPTVPGGGTSPNVRVAATGVSVLKSNPLTLQGVTFEVKGNDGKLAANTQFTSINTTVGPMLGLVCGYGLTIKLPAPTNAAELLITRTIDIPIIEAFDGNNKKVATVQMQNPANQPETIKLSGQNMTRIEVRTIRNLTFLHRICSDSLRIEGEAAVKVTAFGGATPIRIVTIKGQAGQIVSLTLEADAINAIEIGSGPASLVDLCYVPVAQDATQGWERLPAFSYPMGLPVSQADYPCTVAVPQSLLTSRVLHQLPPGWNKKSFTQLHDQLVTLVKGGPSSEPMADRIFAAPPAVSSPPDADPPKLSKFYLLDMILLSTLHPALAQLIGLYWVDQTVTQGMAYDYLIVADHTGVGGRDPNKVLAVIQSAGFAQLDGYIIFNKRSAAAPPLEAPAGLETFELPGGTFLDAQGQLPQASNYAGLRWETGWDNSGALLPERAVMYMVWRADLGNTEVPPRPGIHTLITKLPNGNPKPILVTEARLPNSIPPKRPPDWPQIPLHFIDRNLTDGWYSYQVSGIDLFGRHSLNSNLTLIRLLDRIPPPIPTGIEAYALDPEDPFVVRDEAYKGWFESLNPSVRQTLIGLRVRWIWTKAHQHQAPDTFEFRIYFNPGAALPPDRDQAIKWQERYHVVGYNENVVINVDGDRLYEVFIPLAPSKKPISLPLNPSLAEPVVYAHIGVSAVDDKPHTKDQRTTGKLSNRPGNEGRAGPPVKIYRVLRAKPAPPAALEDTERVDASPADYRDLSYYTYRWQTPKKADNLKLHIFRAMDDAVFKTDWFIRTTRIALDPINPLHERFFPKGWKKDQNRQKAAANELNAITSQSGYNTLTKDAQELLACLPGNDGVKGPAELKQRDWSIRQSRQNLLADDLKAFPGWDLAKRQVVATELNTFVLSGGAATMVAKNKIKLDGNPEIQLVRTHRDTVLLRSDMKRATRQYRIISVDALARTLTLDETPTLTGGKSAWALPLYQTLSDNGLRALAILPGNEAALTQVTIDPLDSYEADPGDATKLRWRDRKGPDNSDDFHLFPDSNARRAYIDRLDGRSTNRYFYRAAFVDGAHNQGELGLVGPVIYLPNVVPPRAPVITKVLGGDRQITIKWASNREPDLAEYRLYRAESEEATRDLRLMTLVHTEAVAAGDPLTRPAEVSWTDSAVSGLVTFYYRLVAADDAGNVSAPYPFVAGRAFDDSRPDPPTWNAVTAGAPPEEIVLSWSSPDAVLTCLLQRSPTGTGRWSNLGGWLARGIYTYRDNTRTAGEIYDYRLRVMDTNGRLNNTFNMLTK